MHGTHAYMDILFGHAYMHKSTYTSYIAELGLHTNKQTNKRDKQKNQTNKHVQTNKQGKYWQTNKRYIAYIHAYIYTYKTSLTADKEVVGCFWCCFSAQQA